MGPAVNFILALAVGVISLSGGSLLWPRITTAPRPQMLQVVHDTVLQTPQGNQAAQVLGVSDEANVELINPGEVVENIVNSIKAAAQKRAQTIIMSQVTAQLTNQYNRLTPPQQDELKNIICKPNEASSSAN